MTAPQNDGRKGKRTVISDMDELRAGVADYLSGSEAKPRVELSSILLDNLESIDGFQPVFGALIESYVKPMYRELVQVNADYQESAKNAPSTAADKLKAVKEIDETVADELKALLDEVSRLKEQFNAIVAETLGITEGDVDKKKTKAIELYNTVTAFIESAYGTADLMPFTITRQSGTFRM